MDGIDISKLESLIPFVEEFIEAGLNYYAPLLSDEALLVYNVSMIPYLRDDLASASHSTGASEELLAVVFPLVCPE